MNQYELIFWLAVGVLAYTYIAYPLLMWGWASLLRRPHRKLDIEPEVSILLVAQDEGRRIRELIENLLALDYPPERREIVIVCDGPAGDTAAQARRYADRGVRVIEHELRRGKSAILNGLVPRLRGDVVVMLDPHLSVEAGALRALVSNFADPSTGAVSGQLVQADRQSGGVGEEYETFIRCNESRVDSTVCTTGAIFAIRRRLWRQLPENCPVEDVLMAMHVVRQGLRVRFEPAARAIDHAAAGSESEFLRKVRTLSDVVQVLLRESASLNPFYNRLWFQVFSHKLLRLLGPLCLVAAFAANLYLLEQPSFRFFLGLQILFYGAAAAGVRQPSKARSSLLNLPCAICMLNWATVKSFFRFVFNRPGVNWEKAKS